MRAPTTSPCANDPQTRLHRRRATAAAADTTEQAHTQGTAVRELDVITGGPLTEKHTANLAFSSCERLRR
jgi:hypothetical protein